jgi:hypothetical protein
LRIVDAEFLDGCFDAARSSGASTDPTYAAGVPRSL